MPLRPPLVLAHRGASRAEPENTVAAFLRAAEMGADGVELDVRRTSDGALAVVHDVHLPDGRLVVETASDDLPDDVPLLADALAACRDLQVINVEIKNQPGEPDFDAGERLATEVVALTRELGLVERVLVSSFHLPTIDAVRAADPAVATAWLVVAFDDVDRGLDTLRRHGHSVLHPHHRSVDAALADACRDAGVALNTWTVDDPDRIAALAALGVDGICTNVPDVALAVIRSAAPPS